MSYIYIYIYIYMERILLMFLDHTQRRTTVGRTPLDEWSARRRDLYLTTHDTHNRQISMPRWDSNPRSQQVSDRRPLTCWDRGFLLLSGSAEDCDHPWILMANSHLSCRAHAVLCRGLEKSLSERHGRSTAWAWHGKCESHTAALCKSIRKGTI